MDFTHHHACTSLRTMQGEAFRVQKGREKMEKHGTFPGTDAEAIKKAVGVGYRKHITDYDTKIVKIPVAYPLQNYFKYETEELTSVCTMTGLPDFYYLCIEVVPRDHIFELKSLKFYLMAYRDVGILHEDLAPKILHDIFDVIDPLWMQVTLQAKTRGGIDATVIAEEGDERYLPEVYKR